jgi:hypothetical protein
MFIHILHEDIPLGYFEIKVLTLLTFKRMVTKFIYTIYEYYALNNIFVNLIHYKLTKKKSILIVIINYQHISTSSSNSMSYLSQIRFKRIGFKT